MALIGNPMDFDRIRQKYESLVYPQGRTLDTNYNQVRDANIGLLNQQQIDPLTGLNVLGGTGSTVMSQDATQRGEQIQLRFNPVTGQTETIIPEYMRDYRTDQQDFLPDSQGSFETIYDSGQGQIDPITGRPTPITSTISGSPTSLISTRPGGGDGRDRDTSRPDNYNFAGGSFVNTENLNEDGSIGYGIHGMFPGGLLARAFTSPARQLATLENISAMNMDYTQKAAKGYKNQAAKDIAKLARNVQGQAEKSGDVETASAAAKLASGYSGLSRDTAQANMEAAEAEAEKNEENQFNLGESITNFFDKITGGSDKKNEGTSTSTNKGIGGFTSKDVTRESFRGGGGDSGGSGGDSNGDSNGGPGGCFVEGTAIQMADGTTKEITTIKLGEETKGGIVQAKMEFLPQNIYNYKDVLVSGSHWVVEDNQLIAVEDSKHGVLTDRIEPVYTFKTSNNRIWINDIEFGDFETGSDADWEPHFEMVRQKLNKELRNG